MAELKLNILRPSVNNLCVRVFVRAADLDFEETDVWGHTTGPEYLGKYPPHLTPTIETEGLPRTTLGESCAIMAYLANVHGLDRFYPTDPGRRALVDNAMFYLIGTLYPLVARATYPTLGFGQYAGEVATSQASDELKAQAQHDAQDALADTARHLPLLLPRRQHVHRRRPPDDRRHPARRDARVPAARSTTRSRTGPSAFMAAIRA